jgi:3-methyladenine DNA glycosylase AlkD
MILTPASSADDIVAHLNTLRNDGNIAGMTRFGIDTSTALGITTPQMQAIARQIKRNHERALALWSTGLRDARMAAILTADPRQLTKEQVRTWAGDFNS